MPFLSIQSLWAGGGVLGSEAVQHWWCWCSLAALWAGCTCSLPSQGCSASGFAEKIRSLHSAGPNIPWDAAVWSLDSVGCSSGSQHWNCCCCSCSAFSPVWGFRVPCARYGSVPCPCSKCWWLTSVLWNQKHHSCTNLWLFSEWALSGQWWCKPLPLAHISLSHGKGCWIQIWAQPVAVALLWLRGRIQIPLQCGKSGTSPQQRLKEIR